jgi:hypothetical protein
MSPSILKLRFIFTLTLLASVLISCKEDNFPSSPPDTNENLLPVNPGTEMSNYCSIILDSIVISPTIYLSDEGGVIVKWFGKVKNTSKSAINCAYDLSAKVYSDSTKKDIISAQSNYFYISNFKPGESYLFEIRINNSIDTIKYPNFYPDSVFFTY